MRGFDIRLERVVEATPEEAFRHWVDAAARRGWYAPDEGSKVVASEADVRVGGSYRVSVVGPRDEPLYQEDGTFEVVDPPNRVVYRSIMRMADGRTVETRVTVTFQEHEGNTLLTLLDQGFTTEELRDEFEGGWPDFLNAYERTLS